MCPTSSPRRCGCRCSPSASCCWWWSAPCSPTRCGTSRAHLTAATATPSAQHSFRQLTTDAAFRAGAQEGTRVAGGSLRIATPRGRTTWAGRSWSWARWTSPWVDARTDLHPARPDVERHHAAAHAGAGPGPGAQHLGLPQRLEAGRRLVDARRQDPAHQRRRPVRPDRLDAHRHPGRRTRRPPQPLPAAGPPPPRSREHRLPDGAIPPGSSEPAVDRPPGDEPAAAATQDAERPALLADDPPRAVPAVGRRWPGLVLPDLAGDDPRLLPRAARPARATPG